jgi:hypothetical protein
MLHRSLRRPGLSEVRLRDCSRFAILLVLLFSPFVTDCHCIGGRGGSSGGSSPSGGGSAGGGSASIGVNSVTMESQWNGRMITGTVKNVTGLKINFVAIEFGLLNDRRFSILKVKNENEKGIEPYGKWEFEIIASAVGAKSSRMSKLDVR